MIPKDVGIKLKIKPLSVNLAWLGTKRKSWQYRTYEKECIERLPRTTIPREGELSITIHVYYSNRGSDVDNVLKPFLDVLQKRYKFNDNRIYELHAYKHIVARGDEGISFKISKIVEDADE